MARLGFDIFARDHASDTLAKVGKAFKQVSKDADDAGKKSGDGFGRGLKRWLTGDGKGLFKQIGDDGGTVFGSGFLGALKTPILGPGIAAILTAAVATALPAVGSIAAGALITGFGAGLAGLGIVFAAKSQVVKTTWTKVLSGMGEQMQLISKPFEDTLVGMAAFMQRTFDTFAPHLQKAFANMAGPLKEFANQASQAFEGFAPAIEPVTNAFNTVLRSLGPALQTSIDQISRGFQDLAQSVQQSPEALAETIRGIGQLTADALKLIGVLNDLNGQFKQMTGVSAVDAAFGSLHTGMAALTAPFQAAKAGLDHLGGSAGDSGAAMLATADAVTKNAQALQGNSAAATAAVGPMNSATTANTAVGASATKTALSLQQQDTWLRNVVTSMSRLANLALGLSGAQISYQAAIDNATASLKENGKTLDINSEKGRANRQALNAVAQAANDQTAAMIQAGKGVANAAVNAEGSRSRFVKLAQQMGLSKASAQALAKQLIAIPNVTRTAKLQAQKRDLDAKLAAAKKQLNDKDLTKERRARLNADISKLQAQIRAAQAAINSLRGKTVTIRMVTVGGIRQDQGVGGGGHTPVEHRAGGGPVTKNTPYLVGENGQEIFVPNSSGKIVPLQGQGGRVTSSIVTVERGLVGSLRALVKAVQSSADKITSLLSKYHELEQSTMSSFQGGLFGGDNAGAALSLGQRLQQRTGQANAFRRALSVLKAKGLNMGLFSELASSGDFASAIQLSQMGAGGIAQLNKQYIASQRAAQNLGTYAAQTVYGKAIRSEQAVMRRRQDLVADIQKALRSAQIRLELKSSGSHADEVLIQLLRTAIRVKGGNVQKVLGTR